MITAIRTELLKLRTDAPRRRDARCRRWLDRAWSLRSRHPAPVPAGWSPASPPPPACATYSPAPDSR